MIFWFYLCLVLLFYNLNILIKESRLIFFNSEPILNDTNKYSFCLSIEELIKKNKLEENETYTPKELIDKSTRSLLIGNENNLILNSSFVRHNYVCINFNLKSFYQIFFNISGYRFKIFINPFDESQIYFFENIYTHTQLNKRNFHIEVEPLNIRFLPEPYETNCMLNSPNYYKKVDCLLNCHKSKKNSTYFYYKYNEAVRLKLDEKELILNQNCLEKCKYEDCFVQIFYRHQKFKEKEDGLPKIDVTNFLLVATPILSSTDFVIQFVFLISLFLNVSLFEILMLIIRSLKNRLNNRMQLLINTYYIALAICLLLVSSITIYHILDFLKFNFLSKKLQNLI